MLSHAIEVRALTCRFGETHALDGIDLDVPRGRIVAILGPNGAGKTTLVRVLSTLTAPTGGQARVMGHDTVEAAHAVRAAIALTGQFASLDDDLTARENLVLIARLLGFSRRAAQARTDTLLAAFELADAARRSVKSFSGGMRRRLDIAASLVVVPQVLFLDEPTTGLDPQARHRVWQIVRAIARRGVTVLLTTQYLEEADQLAERVAVIDRGRKIAEGTSAELKAAVGADRLHLRFNDAAQRERAIEVLASSLSMAPHRLAEGSELSFAVTSRAQALTALQALERAGVDVAGFALGAPSLEEVFFALTQHPDDGRA